MISRFGGFCCLLLAASVPAQVPDTEGTGGAAAGRPDRDVTFFGAGKVARYGQRADGSLETLELLFFAEIFLAPGGQVADAAVTLPGGTVRTLTYEHSASEAIGDTMYLSEIVTDREALTAAFPPGAYRFDFTTANGRVRDAVVDFGDREFPAAPVIRFRQGGYAVDFGAVDAARSLAITWTRFSTGRADPRGILDDLVFVAIDSCTVEDLVHSGRPFESERYLTFRDLAFVVPAGTLAPGRSYSMYVEHAVLADTRRVDGIPAFAALAASTYLDFRTAGAPDPDDCAAE